MSTIWALFSTSCLPRRAWPSNSISTDAHPALRLSSRLFLVHRNTGQPGAWHGSRQCLRAFAISGTNPSQTAYDYDMRHPGIAYFPCQSHDVSSEERRGCIILMSHFMTARLPGIR